MKLLRKWRCPHSNVQGIYGDEINHSHGRRLFCMDCGRLLDGPVLIARLRHREVDLLILADLGVLTEHMIREGSNE